MVKGYRIQSVTRIVPDESVYRLGECYPVQRLVELECTDLGSYPVQRLVEQESVYRLGELPSTETS